MEHDLQTKYDSLCYATFMNIQHLTKGASRMVFRNVDWNNPEHKFVIHIANACYSILGDRQVAIDLGPLTRGAIRRACPSFGRIGKPREDEQIFVNVPEMLDFMRESAVAICGNDFTFGDIYDAYYSGKETR